MNDEQLAVELRRRAEAGSSRPDWAKRVLLPAVWREVDARPQRVITTSRWSPRLGVAAVVAALLIMVVAVPRLVPRPPTSNSSPTESPTSAPAQTSVLSTADFASRLAAGDLDGQTVIVDGRIGPNLRRGPLCGPTGGQTVCYMGSLEGVEPPIDISSRWIATNDEEGVRNDGLRWEGWHFPSTPQTGFLLLSVDLHLGVEFGGLARDTGPGPVTSVGDAGAQHLDINTVGADEVIVVRGWLIETEPPGTTISIDCIRSDFPRVDGLPYNYCMPGDYLSDQEVVGRELLPDGAKRIPVQRNAAQLFGAQRQDGPSLFAIAPRLYGGCFDAPTCWQWDVVARVDQRIWEPLPSRAPTHTFDCGLAPLNGIDETGFVQSCTGMQGPGDGIPLTLSNPDADPNVLEVAWSGVPGCSQGLDALTLRSSSTGYDLTARSTQPVNFACDGVVYETHVLLQLSQPVAADNVRVTYEPTANPTQNPTQPPIPTPSPSPAVTVIECSPLADGGSAGYGTPKVHDEIGLVESCETIDPTLPPGGSTVFNPDGNVRILQVHWGTNPCHARADFYLSRITGNAGYIFHGTTYAVPCRLPLVTHEIRIHLLGEIDAADVMSWWTQDDPQPSTSPSPTRAAISCEGEGLSTTILVAGDLVVSCRHIDPTGMADFGPDPVSVVTIKGERPAVRILWTSSMCTRVAWLTVGANSDHAFFEVSPSASCTLSGALVSAIELVLTRAVDVSAGRVIPV